MTRFKNLTIAAFTALGITLSPVPAAADGQDIAKVIAGIAVLGLIAKAAEDRRDRRKEAVTSSQFGRIDSLDNRRGTRIIEGDIRRPGEFKRKSVGKFKRRALPERCLRIVETNRRDRLVYTRGCLKRHYEHTSRLPQNCVRQIRTDRGLRTVYGARCLARDGWRVARR